MRRISIMATYPARVATVATALGSIAAQVDQAVVVLNQYDAVPPSLATLSMGNVEFVIPSDDLKDTGKFCCAVNDDDQVFLCDDDILYPPDYAARLAERWQTYRSLDAVVGVHGLIYADFFDGATDAILSYEFTYHLADDIFVNQLGTGAVLCGGDQMPDFEFMRSSRGFVDLRFAVHCAITNRPRICISRNLGWMQQIPVGSSLYENLTRRWPLGIVAEAQQIAGFRFLPAAAPAALAGLPTGSAIASESKPGKPAGG